MKKKDWLVLLSRVFFIQLVSSFICFMFVLVISFYSAFVFKQLPGYWSVYFVGWAIMNVLTIWFGGRLYLWMDKVGLPDGSSTFKEARDKTLKKIV